MGQTKKYIEHLLKSLEDPKEAAAYILNWLMCAQS